MTTPSRTTPLRIRPPRQPQFLRTGEILGIGHAGITPSDKSTYAEGYQPSQSSHYQAWEPWGYDKPGYTLTSVYGYNHDRIYSFIDLLYQLVFFQLLPCGITSFQIDLEKYSSDNYELNKLISTSTYLFKPIDVDEAIDFPFAKLINSLHKRNIEKVFASFAHWGFEVNRVKNKGSIKQKYT